MIQRRPAHRSRTTAPLAAAIFAAAASLAVPGGAAADGLGARAFSLSGTSLLSYDLAAPQTPTTTAITGVTAGDTLVGVAVRPQTGDLYAVGINDPADTVQVYHLGARTGLAQPVGSPATFVDAAANPVPLTDASFGVAFNPTVDRIRVVGGGLNFRLDPNTGLPVDGNLGGGIGSVTGVNTDGNINGATGVVTTAYVNRRQNVAVTTQYTLSQDSDSVYIQSPPNSGTQTMPVAFKLGGAALDVSSVSGLDFPTDVSVAAANAAAVGKGYAVLTTGGTTSLATLDLTSGEVTPIGPVGGGQLPVRGLAIQGEEVAGGTPAVGLSDVTLKRFNTATPGTVASVAVGAPAAGETIVAITRRPQTGQFFGLGINATTDTGSLYVVDPQTGALTPVGAASSIALSLVDGVTPVDLPDPATAAYGVDFNPTVDRIRVVTTTGLNFRANPITGAAVDSNPAGGTGTNPDGAINGLPAGSTGVSATSYTNAFAQPLIGGVTTQYTLDPASDSLFIQNPPNNGTQTVQKAITLSGAPLDFSLLSGFDIPSSVAVETSSTPASGMAFAGLTVAGVGGLYTIDLATGAATKVGDLAAGASLDSLVIGDPPPAFVPPVVVVPTTPPATTPPATTPPADLAPTLTGLSLSPKSFRTGKRPKGASTKVKTGTTISLTLSEAATVTFTVDRIDSGRKSGSTCKKQTSKNRKAKKCTRYTKIGTFTATGKTGKNSVKFSGKVGKKTLAKAKYRLTAVAADPAKQTSKAASATFTIVR